MKLNAQRCKPIPKGTPALTDKVSKALLNAVPGWKMKSKTITRSFHFESYWAGWGFVNALAWIAQAEDHHPEIVLGHKEVLVTFSTHSVKGLSHNDFICASKANSLIG
jgi:4a-hydroxytetrahydrobiopterin dehydratase